MLQTQTETRACVDMGVTWMCNGGLNKSAQCSWTYLDPEWQLKTLYSLCPSDLIYVCVQMNNFKTLNVLEWKTDRGFWTKTNHTEGKKIRGKEIGCTALKILTQTSSADNESEPEQLFVLAGVTLKLAHLPLTEGPSCILPDTIVFNILKFCLFPLCFTFNNRWKKWGFFFSSSAGSSHQAALMGWRGAAQWMSV